MSHPKYAKKAAIKDMSLRYLDIQHTLQVIKCKAPGILKLPAQQQMIGWKGVLTLHRKLW